MTATAISRVSSACVPVSVAETDTSSIETCVPASCIKSIRQMRRLVGRLVHDYGWTLGQDGNLYASNPSTTAWGERVN
jgi:hypothetical protein